MFNLPLRVVQCPSLTIPFYGTMGGGDPTLTTCFTGFETGTSVKGRHSIVFCVNVSSIRLRFP